MKHMKMTKIQNCLRFLCLVLLIGCSNEWKDGKYFVRESPEDPSEKTLYMELSDGNAQGKVEQIRMIGNNKTHIIVKGAKDQFWIIKKNDGSVTGPLALDEFKLVSFKMKLDDIDLKKI